MSMQDSDPSGRSAVLAASSEAGAEVRPLSGASKEGPRLQRWENVDSLRGLAALGVCWYHITHGGKLIPFAWLRTASAQGWLGVEVFFVISGFVIPWAMMRERYGWNGYYRFLAKRVVRLHPPYVLAMVFVILLNRASALAAGFKGDVVPVFAWSTVQAFGRDFLYLSGWLRYPWVIVVSWSLAIEIQFYLLAGLALPFLPPRDSWRTALGMLSLCAVAFFWPDPRGVGHYLPLFLLGWSVALIGVSRTNGGRLLPFATAAVGCWFILAATQGLLIAGVGGLAGLAIILGHQARTVRPLLWLGTISYSLYLVHVPIGGRVVNLGLRFSGVSPLALALLATVVSLLSAWCFYRWVERPALGWSRRLFARVR